MDISPRTSGETHACEAYVKSQASQGWRTLPQHYDDSAYSGGNLERPALKKLLADIEAGKVDVIVIYKLHRLTRSLADFKKIGGSLRCQVDLICGCYAAI